MIKLLVKKQLTEIFRSYFYDAKKNKARSRASTVGFIVLYAIIMVGLLGGIICVFAGIKNLLEFLHLRKRERDGD